MRFTALLFFLVSIAATCLAQECSRLDLVVILDNSGSVMDVFEKEKALALDLTGGIPIQAGGSQVGIVTFASDANVVLPLYPAKDRDAVLNALSAIKHRGGSTNVVDSFEKAKRLFASSTAPKKVIIIVTDGNSQNKWGDILRICQSIRKSGIEIHATTQSNEFSKKELLVYTGSNDRVYPKGRVAKLRKVLTDLAGPNCPGPVKPVVVKPTPPPATPAPRRTAAPRRTPSPPRVTRPPVTLGATAPPVTDRPVVIPSGDCTADLLFIIDTSGSVLRDFRQEVVYTENIIKLLQLGDTGKHSVGVIEYSAYNRQNIFVPFGKFQKTGAELVEKLKNMEYYGGTTYTARALQLAKKMIQETRRPGKNLAVIVLHDGISYDDPEPISKEIRALPQTEVFGVGINKLVLVETLNRIAGNPNRVFLREDSAPELLKALAPYISCTPVPTDPPTAPPTLAATAPPRTAPPTTTTRATPPPATTEAPPPNCIFDVVIVLDTSNSVKGAIFDHEIARVDRIVDRFVIGPQATQVAFIDFAGPGTARTTFPLNKYRNKNDIKDAVRATKFIAGTTAAGDALRLAYNELTPAQGARPGVAEQIVIFVSDGLSQQPVESAARQLKTRADRVYSLATDRFYGPDKLKAIASDERKWYHTDDPAEKARFEKNMDTLTRNCK